MRKAASEQEEELYGRVRVRFNTFGAMDVACEPPHDKGEVDRGEEAWHTM
jgi:hypothetical protein